MNIFYYYLLVNKIKMPKLISFDIGIKNLAYCIFEFSETNSKILDWNVLDISKEKEEI